MVFKWNEVGHAMTIRSGGQPLQFSASAYICLNTIHGNDSTFNYIWLLSGLRFNVLRAREGGHATAVHGASQALLCLPVVCLV